ncbi:hypothetical protein HanXRQr2_Chr01g0007491 [Helianthus annuus]|uniref:Uncharacterized protein n=1 Tax=Helianthus annuus TaxID=4232 RepID=A0A251VL76_HELAN|nr:hypothetical protein HanXRQr2_Chr01g0007491 [Helianthus annuus]
MRASKRNRNCDDQWWFSTMILDSSTAVILKEILNFLFTRTPKPLISPSCLHSFLANYQKYKSS